MLLCSPSLIYHGILHYAPFSPKPLTYLLHWNEHRCIDISLNESIELNIEWYVGGVHYLPNGGKNITVSLIWGVHSFVCYPQSDLEYLPPYHLSSCVHMFEWVQIWVLPYSCLDECDFLILYDKMAYWKNGIVVVTYTWRTFLTVLFDPCFTCVKNQ